MDLEIGEDKDWRSSSEGLFVSVSEESALAQLLRLNSVCCDWLIITASGAAQADGMLIDRGDCQDQFNSLGNGSLFRRMARSLQSLTFYSVAKFLLQNERNGKLAVYHVAKFVQIQ